MAKQDTSITSVNKSEPRALSEQHHMAHQPLEVFTLFAKLPPELRLAIFQQAIEDVEPRLVTINKIILPLEISQVIWEYNTLEFVLTPEKGGLCAKKIPTALLHTCSDSRRLAMKRYDYLRVVIWDKNTPRDEPCGHWEPAGFFDFSHDTLSAVPTHIFRKKFRDDCYWNFHNSMVALKDFIWINSKTYELKKVKKLRIPESPHTRHSLFLESCIFSKFTGLKHLTIVICGLFLKSEWTANLEEAILSTKAKNPNWIPPTWGFEQFGASERVSSTLEAL
ncbi:hypothetical protein VTL71DRAFT_10626 [Oculimacula yallundae]|uniref:2EXR domain-containing protein n=1 Tax=Oculimacula yallundae TaxID=86028 RepID=A0ABR4CU13_9HELO